VNKPNQKKLKKGLTNSKPNVIIRYKLKQSIKKEVFIMTERMTNVKAIAYVIENCEVPQEVAEKLEKIKASFEKKASGERKPTKTQEQNEGLKSAILNHMETDVLYSIGQLAKEVPELVAVGASGQKVSALVKQLKDAGLVVRVEEKRKAFFKRA